MSLTLTIGRDAFKLCHKEGARTTVWDVSKNDSEESLIQTFKDVIAFVEGATDVGKAIQKHLEREATYREADAVTAAQPGNGWAAVYGPPELPEDRKGEWELVQPGEDT